MILDTLQDSGVDMAATGSDEGPIKWVLGEMRLRAAESSWVGWLHAEMAEFSWR